MDLGRDNVSKRSYLARNIQDDLDHKEKEGA